MKKNDFGYEQVNKDEHYNRVQEVFNNVANEYDFMNDVMSFGFHRNWKKEFVGLIEINDENSIDVITLSFGIRNMTDRIKCLKECYRVLKPGGQFLCMEFSMPENYTLRNIYDAWSFFVIPKLGKLIAKSEESYKYLIESIRTFPKPDEFVEITNKFKFLPLKLV